MMNKNHPECMEYLGNNKYRCTKGKIPDIIVEPKNLPINCTACGNTQQNSLHEYPSTFGLAKNFGKAMVNYAKSGFQHVSEEEYKERLDICKDCELYDSGRCKHKGCGCFISKKAWIKTEECPENKWPRFFMSNGEIFIPRVENPFTYITAAQLMDDTNELVKILPTDFDIIVGSARSGMLPATNLACRYHKPLYSSDDSQVLYVGNGWRLSNYNIGEVKKILLIEDTVYNGNTIKRCYDTVQKKFPNAEIITAAIYCRRASTKKIDYYSVELNGNHFLEWNLFNAAIISNAAIDFDGILCEDIRPQDDDDGERYLNAIQNAVPKFFVRRAQIPMIVTARMEKYRYVTLEWLKKHDMSVDKLIMGPWNNLQERTLDGVIELKAKSYMNSKLGMFVESCPHQAKRICEISGKHVLCPAAGQVFTK